MVIMETVSRPVATRDASDVSDATIITAGQFIVLKKWKLVDDPSLRQKGRSLFEDLAGPLRPSILLQG